MIKRFKSVINQALGKNLAPASAVSGEGLADSVLSFYANFIDSGSLCFDVGANTGNRADIFLALGARVICVEPQPACIAILESKYHGNPQVTIVAQGLAAEPGIMSLAVCESESTIATFSDKWKMGRFSSYDWKSEIEVPMTTLDALIEQFGLPVFCKLDVEGFEYQVLQGLSRSIPVLSFEFTKEFLNDAKFCVNYLSSLEPAEFNYANGEMPGLALPTWADGNTLLNLLDQISDVSLWGDIYVRFTDYDLKQG